MIFHSIAEVLKTKLQWATCKCTCRQKIKNNTDFWLNYFDKRLTTVEFHVWIHCLLCIQKCRDESEIYNYQRMIHSLMRSWGLSLTWVDCKVQMGGPMPLPKLFIKHGLSYNVMGIFNSRAEGVSCNYNDCLSKGRAKKNLFLPSIPQCNRTVMLKKSDS